MLGAVVHAPGDVRYRERPDPVIVEPTDAVVRTVANCLHGSHYDGAQAERIRIPWADGTLVATPQYPDDDLVPSLLTLSDVMCTGWHAAVGAGVGTEGTRLQACGAVRPGGAIGRVGVPHGDLPMQDLFWRNVGVKGGPAHVRSYLPHLMDLVLNRRIEPGLVVDLELPLSQVAEGYAAMDDERRAIKTLLRP